MLRVKQVLKYVLIISLAVFLLWFSFQSIETQEGQSKVDFILDTWGRGNKGFLFLSAFLAILSHLIRAARWHIILRPLGYSFSIVSSFISVMLSYFINLAIPRGGELSRCVTLYRLEKVPVKTSLGTVIAERVVDLVFLVICIGTVFLLELNKFLNFFSTLESERNAENLTQEVSYTKYYILGVLLVGIIVGIVLLIKKRWLFLRLIIKIKDFLKGLKQGLTAIFQLEQKVLFITYSLAIWCCYYFMAYAVFLAYPETQVLGLDAALTIFVLGGIAMAIPLPGGTGSYHLLVSRGLFLLYGISKTDAMAFATIFHGWQTLVIIIFGVICLIASELLAKNTYNPENEK